MKRTQRKAIQKLLAILEGLARGVVATENSEGAPTLIEEDLASRAYRPPQTILSPQKLKHLNEQLKEELRRSRELLIAEVSEHDAYSILFPLVVTLDEIVLLRYAQADMGDWPALQKDLFQVDQGGEVFYTLLDEALEVSHYPTLCYEVFFFCLRVGFRGRYSGNEDRISAYLDRLGQRLVSDDGEVGSDALLDRSPAMIRPSHSPLWYYSAVAIVLLALYMLLGHIGSLEEDLDVKSESMLVVPKLLPPPGGDKPPPGGDKPPPRGEKGPSSQVKPSTGSPSLMGSPSLRRHVLALSAVFPPLESKGGDPSVSEG
ncbi:MAG: DotU family type IV/VI secretion system protein [Deltaproteobacteria bacterium]|nr:DotU family type IV/VI secretion system protein [Deltaproteobacteria bacterium]